MYAIYTQKNWKKLMHNCMFDGDRLGTYCSRLTTRLKCLVNREELKLIELQNDFNRYASKLRSILGWTSQVYSHIDRYVILNKYHSYIFLYSNRIYYIENCIRLFHLGFEISVGCNITHCFLQFFFWKKWTLKIN